MTQPERLTGILDGLQHHLDGTLKTARAAHEHPVARGDASEQGWLSVLQDHLPHRYRADRATVIDSMGAASDVIDIVIYDRQYSPLLLNHKGQRYVPAESVYAVLEVKQNLSRKHVRYAADKAASMRRLHRTSYRIPHAGGEFKPRPPHRILAGIVAYKSNWSDPLGPPLHHALGDLDPDAQLDIGCALTGGTFEARYDAGNVVTVACIPGPHTLVEFFFRLLRQMQALATAPAIDYGAYLDAFAARRGGKEDHAQPA